MNARVPVVSRELPRNPPEYLPQGTVANDESRTRFDGSPAVSAGKGTQVGVRHPSSGPRIGEMLVSRGLVTTAQVEAAVSVQRITGISMPLGHILAAHGAASLHDIESVVRNASHHRDSSALTPITLPPSLCRVHGIKPLGLRGDALVAAALDDLDETAVKEIIKAAEDASGLQVNTVFIEPMDRRELLMWLNATSGVDIRNIEADIRVLVDTQEIDGGILNRLIRKVVDYAIDEKISDLHWERNGMLTTGIAMRQHGTLTRALPVTERVMSAMLARLKVMSNMDFSEMRRDQDGSFNVERGNRTIHLRVSSKPSVNGESIVMRLQDPDNLQPISALMSDHGAVATRLTAIAANAARRAGAGLALFTGPMGSGKSSSMAGMMMDMPRHEAVVMTVEDPVEIVVPLVIHTAINEALGIDFPRALRGMKRQDVNVIVAGEIRDVETALESIRMAQSGHLTMATLHTDDALGTLPALMSYFSGHPFMSIARTELPQIIRVIVNQRLVPRLCPACRRPYVPTDDERNALAAIGCPVTMFFRSDGCERCSGTGVAGRVLVPDALFFPDTKEAREHLARLAATDELQRAGEVPGTYHYTRHDAINTLLSAGQISPTTATGHLEGAA